MPATSYENQVFEKSEFPGTYNNNFENCQFIGCNFTGQSLSDNDFIDCIFDNCNLSLIKLENSGLKDVEFKNCKITGVNFSKCGSFMFSASFTNCMLDYSVFFKKIMKSIVFTNCSLKEVDFSECDLTKSIFKNCDLTGTIFMKTKLNSVDFRTAYNFSIDPELNTLKKAKFSVNNLFGLLTKHDIVID